MTSILRVALDVPLDRLFDYRCVGDDDVRPGRRVLVPFGPRRVVGVVVERAAESELDPSKLKDIAGFYTS